MVSGEIYTLPQMPGDDIIVITAVPPNWQAGSCYSHNPESPERRVALVIQSNNR
jgi:hypothetical protein